MACVGDFCEILAPIGGFSGMGHRMLPIAFLPRPIPVAMGTKFGTKWAITRLAQEIFAPIGGFSGMGHRMLPTAFSPTDPRCHGNEIWDKIGYNSACVKDFSRFLRLGL